MKLHDQVVKNYWYWRIFHDKEIISKQNVTLFQINNFFIMFHSGCNVHRLIMFSPLYNEENWVMNSTILRNASGLTWRQLQNRFKCRVYHLKIGVRPCRLLSAHSSYITPPLLSWLPLESIFWSPYLFSVGFTLKKSVLVIFLWPFHLQFNNVSWRRHVESIV